MHTHSLRAETPPGPRGRGADRRPGAAALLLPLLLPLLASPALAQAPDTLRQDTVYRIEPIAVRAIRPSTTPGGVSAVVVRLDSVRFRPAPLLEDVLRELPLVQVRTNSRGEATIALRGAEERQIAVLLDGIPLTLGWDHRTDLSVVPLTAARSIELVRGLSSVLYGPNVLGGVVEIGTFDAPPPGAPSAGVPSPDPDALRVAAGVDQTGGYSAGAVGGAALELGAGRLAVRGGIGRRSRDGVPAPADLVALYAGLGGTDVLANSDLDHTDGFASARFQAGSGAWVSTTATAFRAERGVVPELDQEGPRLWRYPETSRVVTVLGAGTGALESAVGPGRLEASLGVDLGTTRIDDYLAPEDPARADLPADSFFATVDETEASEDRTLTARVVAAQSLPGGATLEVAATGADVHHDETITTDRASGTPGVFPASYRQRLWSVGAELDLPFGLGLGPLGGGRVSGGLAVDGADTPETGGQGDGPSLSEWGGRLGLSATTTGGRLLLHASLSRRGRFPSLREMYSTALGRFAPNPGLRPEILTAVEAGFTSRLGPYDLQVVGFRQRLDHAIVRGAPPAGSDARYQRVNRDEIRSRGIEILAGYARGRFALETELTLQDVEVVEPGSPGVRAEYEPGIAGGIGGTVPFPAGIEAGAEIEFRGRQFCSAPSPGQEGYEELAPSARADLQLARSFPIRRTGGSVRRIGVELAVDNVTDGVVYDQCGLPQPGRTLRLQVRLD